MKEVDKKFEKDYAVTSSMTDKLPPDVMLKLYAYYKQATKGINYTRPAGQNEVTPLYRI